MRLGFGIEDLTVELRDLPANDFRAEFFDGLLDFGLQALSERFEVSDVHASSPFSSGAASQPSA